MSFIKLIMSLIPKLNLSKIINIIHLKYLFYNSQFNDLASKGRWQTFFFFFAPWTAFPHCISLPAFLLQDVPQQKLSLTKELHYTAATSLATALWLRISWAQQKYAGLVWSIGTRALHRDCNRVSCYFPAIACFVVFLLALLFSILKQLLWQNDLTP